jgi:hypothetical protein
VARYGWESNATRRQSATVFAGLGARHGKGEEGRAFAGAKLDQACAQFIALKRFRELLGPQVVSDDLMLEFNASSASLNEAGANKRIDVSGR